jgi:hypothetical protein
MGTFPWDVSSTELSLGKELIVHYEAVYLRFWMENLVDEKIESITLQIDFYKTPLAKKEIKLTVAEVESDIVNWLFATKWTLPKETRMLTTHTLEYSYVDLSPYNVEIDLTEHYKNTEFWAFKITSDLELGLLISASSDYTGDSETGGFRPRLRVVTARAIPGFQPVLLIIGTVIAVGIILRKRNLLK